MFGSSENQESQPNPRSAQGDRGCTSVQNTYSNVNKT